MGRGELEGNGKEFIRFRPFFLLVLREDWGTRGPFQRN